MKDIKLLEKCEKCGKNLTLMESIRHPEGTLWAVKRCLNCGGHPAEEAARLLSDVEEDAIKKQEPISPDIECDDEFTCPTCGKTTEDYDVTTLKFCPECGQKFDWKINYPECVDCACYKCTDGYCKTEICQEGCIHYGKAHPYTGCTNSPGC